MSSKRKDPVYNVNFAHCNTNDIQCGKNLHPQITFYRLPMPTGRFIFNKVGYLNSSRRKNSWKVGTPQWPPSISAIWSFSAPRNCRNQPISPCVHILKCYRLNFGCSFWSNFDRHLASPRCSRVPPKEQLFWHPHCYTVWLCKVTKSNFFWTVPHGMNSHRYTQLHRSTIGEQALKGSGLLKQTLRLANNRSITRRSITVYHSTDLLAICSNGKKVF